MTTEQPGTPNPPAAWPPPAYPAWPHPGGQYPGAPYPGTRYASSPYPAFGFPPPRLANRPPAGGTAIAAAILACWAAISSLIGIIEDFGLLGIVSSPFARDIAGVVGPGWTLWTQGWASAIELVILGFGTTLLFLRRPLGRWLTTVGCAVRVVVDIVVLTARLLAGAGASLHLLGVAGEGLVAMASGAGMVIPVIALILVLLPSTGRWLAWRPETAGPAGQTRAGAASA